MWQKNHAWYILNLCALNLSLNFYPLSLFAEIGDVDLSQNFPNVLTIHSGNNERLKVGIVLRSGTQKWKQQRATFMGTTEAKSVAAKAKMASFNFKAQYIDQTVRLLFSVSKFDSFLAGSGRNQVCSTCYSAQMAHKLVLPGLAKQANGAKSLLS